MGDLLHFRQQSFDACHGRSVIQGKDMVIYRLQAADCSSPLGNASIEYGEVNTTTGVPSGLHKSW
jgi:hypothetical protein